MIQSPYPPRAYRPPPTLETASTEKEARRVLAWQQDVARSVSLDDTSSQAPSYRDPPPDYASPPPIKRGDTYPVGANRLVRKETVTSYVHRGRGRDDGERERDAGWSRGKVIGTLLGAAAGAAVAYAMVRSESPERIPQAPAHIPPSHTVPRSHRDDGSTYEYAARREVVEHVPSRSYVSAAPTRSYARSRSDIQPRYVAAPPPVRALERIDERSYVSVSSSRRRARSEVGSRYERPLAILPAPTPRERSPVSGVSRRSSHLEPSHHGSLHTAIESYHTSSPKEREGSYHTSTPQSYHTARSAHTASTIKAAPRSKVSVHPSQIELPRSVLGSVVSVAPSDSVSSVGSKRERERLVGRMRTSERW